MTQEFTITFPAVSTETIEQLDQTEQLLAAREIAFVATLRTKFGSLATLDGSIRISDYKIGNQNWCTTGKTWLSRGGRRVKGLLSADGFASPFDSESAGKHTGERLYLTATGWVEITRTGSWSQWQDTANYWTCDGNFADRQEFEVNGGGIRWLTDEQVAHEYDIKDVAEMLAKSLKTLAVKIPERMNRKRALAETFKTITAQLA